MSNNEYYLGQLIKKSPDLMHQNLQGTVWGPAHLSWALGDSYDQANLGNSAEKENGEIILVIEDYQKLL